MKNVVNKVVKKDLKGSPILIPFQKGDNITILKNLEQQSMSVIKLKTKLCTTYMNFPKILEGRRRDRQIWLVPLNINTTILKSKLLSSFT